tara:strand:- start:617 stop:1354 length:738 start_codon:yes stop_codon:yes gene_type:complete
MLFTPQVSGSHTSKSNKILAIGDSFFDYRAKPCYQLPAAKDIIFWPEIIANELNAQIDIVGYSGADNEYIFKRLLDHTNEVDYDLVIVNWTQLWRFTVQDFDNHVSANYLPSNMKHNDEAFVSDQEWMMDIYQILFYETNFFCWENIRIRTQRVIDTIKKMFPNSIQVWGPEPIDHSLVEKFDLSGFRNRFDIHNRKNINFRVARWCLDQKNHDKYFCGPRDGHPNTFANQEIAKIMMPKVKEML